MKPWFAPSATAGASWYAVVVVFDLDFRTANDPGHRGSLGGGDGRGGERCERREEGWDPHGFPPRLRRPSYPKGDGMA